MKPSRVQDAPIWKHITQELRLRITSGKVAIGGRLPTEHELCATYGVSRTSAMRALNTLVAEGLVRRERGRGRGTTVIANADPATTAHWVPIVLPQTGHFYDPLAHHLTQGLTSINRFTVLFTADALRLDDGWQRLIGLGGVATILHGTDQLTAGMDRHWRNLPFPVFIGRWPGRSYRASLVLIDRTSGLLGAAKLALARGCRSLVYFQHVVAASDPETREQAESLQILAAQHGTACHYQPVWTTDDAEAVRIAKATAVLAASGPRTVVLCGADFYAREVIAAASGLGWKVGVDVGIVGFNNTPWADALRIDSVSLQEQELANAVVRLVHAGTLDEITVPSVLVERGSIPTW